MGKWLKKVRRLAYEKGRKAEELEEMAMQLGKWTTLWSLAVVLFLAACSDGSADGDDASDGKMRVCDGQYDEGEEAEPCSCQAFDLGFCIQYHSDAGNLGEGECAELGGTEVEALCPTEDVVGICYEVDDCHDPAHYFYSDYSGGFEGHEDLPALQAACEAGMIVGGTCATWGTER